MLGGPPDSTFNIAWLFGRISQTLTKYSLGVSIEYSLGVLVGPPDSTVNIAWSFGRIIRTLTKYSLSVIIGQPDGPFPLEKLIHLLCIGLGRTWTSS